MTVRIEEMTWVEYADRIGKGGVSSFRSAPLSSMVPICRCIATR